MKDFDVVIIGSGLGGLSAATSLSKAGKRVLVLEKNNVPGGYASSFLRGRFEFEVALHELSGLGTEANHGALYKLLNDYGVYPKVDFLQIGEFFHSIFPDFEITVPKGRENFETTLCNQFPKYKDSIKVMTETIFNFTAETLKANRIGMKAVMNDPSQFPTLEAHFGKTVEQVMTPIIKDEKVRAVFNQIWGYLLLPPSKLSFSMYALSFASYLRFGPAHIRGTSQALSQAFVEAIEKMGGQVWLNHGARKITISNNKIDGVITTQGIEIATPYIISNVNPISTCIDLIGANNIPNWYLKRLGLWNNGGSTFSVFLGLDCEHTRLGLKTHENFVNLSYDMNKQYELAHTIPSQPDGIGITAFNAADPEFSMPGTSVVSLIMVSYIEPWLKLSPAEYIYTKNKLTDQMIVLAEKAAPKLREHIEVIEVGTPLTNMRYSGNPGGSIIGFDENYQGSGLSHLPNKGPIDGLYFANAWVNIGGGFETCILSGSYAANEVLKDMSTGIHDTSVNEKIKNQLEKESSGTKEISETTLVIQKKAIERLHSDSLFLRVKEIISETASTKTLRLESVNDTLPFFKAGQYISLIININGVTTSRPYSISSSPGKSYYDITVRRVQNGFVSHFLHDHIKKGDIIQATGPHGNFYYEPLIDTDNLIFLAGGSGITPFMSMIRDTIDNNLPLNIHLLYGSRTPDDIIFKDELLYIASKNKNIRVDFIISEPSSDWNGITGLLDADIINSLIGKIGDQTFFICGPTPMHALSEQALNILNIKPKRIRKEISGPPADVTLESGWPGISPQMVFDVIEERSGKIFKARANEPLIISMEKAGIIVHAVCRSGECTACRTRLVEGKVFTPSRVNKRWIDKKYNYIHPCMSYPVENIRIRL